MVSCVDTASLWEKAAGFVNVKGKEKNGREKV